MAFDRLTIWMVCLSCGLLCFKAISLPRDRSRGWAIVSGGILAATLAALYWIPEWAAGLGGGLWAMLVAIPLLGVKWVDRWCLGERYDRASRLAACLCWLHPADGWVERVALLRGMALAQAGNLAAARKWLDPDRLLKGAIDRSAVAQWYAVNADWTGLLAWLSARVPKSVLYESPELMAHYLRALGETGQVNELVEAWEYDRSRWAKWIEEAEFLERLQLYLWAFSGRVAEVKHGLKGGARFYPRETQKFWLATAQLAAGQRSIARTALQELQPRAALPLQRAIAWRLSQPPTSFDLTPASRQILSRWASKTGRGHPSPSRVRPPQVYGTLFLIAANLVAFALEVQLGGSENFRVLDRLGAMIPDLVWEGQWWRLATATFLHFGAAHLVMNMLGLYVLGISVEPILGIGRYLWVYLGSGVGSMLVTAILARMEETPATLVVGASGAVMGLVGAIAAILLASWRQHKASMARERLNRILLILGVQTLFDWLNPQVCFACHASGAILGFAIASLLIRRHKVEGFYK